MAIDAGDVRLCQKLVESGENLDAGFWSCLGCTPLLYSLHQGQPEISLYLVAQGATIAGETCTNWHTVGFTAVHYAATYGYSELLQQLLKRSSEDSLQRLYPNPIHLAIAHGQTECAQILIEYAEKGIQPRPSDLDQNLTLFLITDTFLITSCAPQDPQPRPSIHTSPRGCDLGGPWLCNLRHKFLGSTPLHTAAIHGNVKITDLLLNSGSPPMCLDSFQRTPLHLAATRGCTATAKSLLKAGANPHAVDSYLQTPCIMAALSNRVETLAVLVEAGADLQARDLNYRTLLHSVVATGAWPSLHYILSKTTGYKLAAEDVTGESILSSIFRNGPPQIIKLFLHAELQVDACSHCESNILTAATVNKSFSPKMLKCSYGDCQMDFYQHF